MSDLEFRYFNRILVLEAELDILKAELADKRLIMKTMEKGEQGLFENCLRWARWVNDLLKAGDAMAEKSEKARDWWDAKSRMGGF